MAEKKYKAIIWDWNGTLLNDVSYSINCINVLLYKRGLPLLNLSTYRKVFQFPVKKYYEQIGFNFNKESWNDVAMEFMNQYWENMYNINLYNNAALVLKMLQKKGIKQFVVSAMEHEKLNEFVKYHRIDNYFDNIYGIDNHYAHGKGHLAVGLLNESDLQPTEVLWIGDTVHDYEVAKELNIDTALVAFGHQHKDLLTGLNNTVYDSLDELYCMLEFM